MRSGLLIALIPVALYALGCSQNASGTTGEQPGNGQVRVETVIGGLEVPWSIAFAPDGRMLITERPGRVRVAENGKLRDQPLATIPDVVSSGESGLMGLTLHPKFSENRLLYLSYGHRNAQGLAWQPGTGLMFQTEHGPSGFDGPGGGDEVNIVERGKNYGWPVIHHNQSRDEMESPLLEYTPAVAPAGAAFLGNDLYFACLRGVSLMRITLDGRRVIGQERMFQGHYGRIRAVTVGPAGAIYFSTSNRDGRGSPAPQDDRILRLIPAK